MPRVKPTKTKLMELKKSVKLYRRSHRFLKNKYEMLSMRLLRVISEMRESLEEINEGLDYAYSNLTQAKILMGELEFNRESMTFIGNPRIDVSWSFSWGLELPALSFTPPERVEYPRWQTPIAFDRSVSKFEDLLKSVVSFAEKKAIVDSLRREVENTKRKVNVLEQVLIPEIQKNISYVESILEDREREDFVRLKKIRGAR